MRITVMLFAVLRDRAGTNQIDLELPVESTAADASRQLGQRFPAIADFLPRVAHAVNQTYVPASTVLNEGDELALIPPVSGGCA
jgi:molybdopterin converting factor subunit 1